MIIRIRLNFDIFASEFRGQGNKSMLSKLSSEDLASKIVFSLYEWEYSSLLVSMAIW